MVSPLGDTNTTPAHLGGLTAFGAEVVQSVKAMVDAVGVDHVGIGSGTDLLSSRVGQGTNKAWPGLTGGFFHAVVSEMLLEGFMPDDIGKIGGGNFGRVFGKVTAGHA